MARPTKYDEQILKDTQSYIDACNDTYDNVGTDENIKLVFNVNIPTIEGLALKLKLNKDTIYSWRKEHEEFSDLIEDLLAKQANALVNKGLNGQYNPTIAKVLLTKHGYREGTDVTTQGEKITTPLTDQAIAMATEFTRQNLLNAKPDKTETPQ